MTDLQMFIDPDHPAAIVWLAVALVLGALVGLLLAALLWRQVAGRRRAEQRAAQAQAELVPLAQAVSNAGEAVIATDVARRILWVNAAFTRMTGFTADEAKGQSPGRLLQFEGTDPLTIARMRQALDAGQPFIGEVLNRSKDGQPYWTELHMQPAADDRGQLSGFISFQSDISDRKRAEAAMKESRSLLDKIGRIGGVGGWVLDLATREVQWTEQACRMLEAEPDFVPTFQDCLAAVAPEARPKVQQMLGRSLADCAFWDLELPLLTRRGREIWVHVVAEAEYGDRGPERVVGALQDITSRRELKAQLQRQAALLRGAFEAVDEAFALFDPDDRLVFCNERFRELYAASAAVIVPGVSFEQIIRHGAACGQYEAAVGRVEEWVAQQMAAHRAADRTLVQRLCDGRILRVIDRKMPDGHTVGFRVDITELVRATEAAEGADRAKSQFIATISHELRTPLQSITGFSDLGRHFAQGHAQFEPMFEDIHAAGMRMLTLVNDLLDVSKIDGRVGSLTLRQAELWPLVVAVAHELHGLADQRSVRFELAQPDAALLADCDAFRLQQVLRNVMANALRFAPPGSLVRLSGRDLGAAGVELCVQDHGPGIPVDELESVFEPFVQSSRTQDGSGGTGLGLAICRRIMSAHAGQIRAEAPGEGGTLIRLSLPPALVPPAAATPPAAGADPASEHAGAPAAGVRRVLRPVGSDHLPATETN
jgi:PAS domain S-box-containing protein